MSLEPRVSVLMSVHNDRPYVAEAIESIRGQTFADFEFILIDDASTDGSRDVIDATDDHRVSVICNPSNLGLTRSLNIGLDVCRGEFVARMDADDVALPARLEAQVRFLDTHPEIGICGTARELIDERGKVIGVATPPLEDGSIRWRCLLGNPFAHPSVMLRRDVLSANDLRYDEAFRTAQDYELWTRLLQRTRGANLAEPLLKYRLRDGGISRSRREEQLASHDQISLRAIERLVPGFPITLSEVTELRSRFGGNSVRDQAKDPLDPQWKARLEQLRDAFAREHADYSRLAA